MSAEHIEASRAELVTTVASVLRQFGRDSAHPSDQADLRRAATLIAHALQAEFVVVARQSSAADPTERQQLSAQAHE